MRAVVAELTVPRYLLTAAAQTLPRGAGHAAGWTATGLLSLRDDLPEPRLPDAPGWVRLRPELAGICGSDVAVVHAKSSLVLSAYYTARRQILGHEIVAVVERTGPGVTRVAEGDRVAVDPVLSCVHRGFAPCRSCREGHPYVCERFDEPGASGCSSPTQGFDAALGGGWGEVVVAHETQLHAVGATPARRAVLAEPASIALHAALRWPRRGDRAVVIGPGTIGLLLTATLRRLHPDLDITVLGPGGSGPGGSGPGGSGPGGSGPGGFAQDRALRAGASRTLPSGPRAVEALAHVYGGRVIRPRMTRTPLLEQGVDVIFDCVGGPATIDLGLHLLRPTGMLVLIGSAGRQKVDWSLVWNRQLTVQGTVNSGPEPALGGRPAMSEVVGWLAEPSFPAGDLVTHTFPLASWRTALDTASAGPRAQAVKVTLTP